MKRSRISAAAVAAALAGSSALLVASPATAATTIDDVTFYVESDFGVESSGYPADVDWFWGDVSGTEGPHAFTVGGLVLNEDLSGDVQLLNQDVVTPPTATDMLDLLDDVDIYSTEAEWNFQLAFFGEPGDEFTTLRPNVLGGTSSSTNRYGLDLATDWVTSGPIYAADGVTEVYPAGAAAPIDDLINALYADGDTPELLAYGFFVDASVSATIQGIWWDGAASAFTPAITRSFPSSISITDASTTGIPVSMTGALPGTTVYIYLDEPEGETVYGDNLTPFGPDGTYATSIVVPADAPLGTYTLDLDDNGYVYQFLGLWPDEQPLEITAALLPATGGDASLVGIAAIVLLGGVVIVVASRRMLRA